MTVEIVDPAWEMASAIRLLLTQSPSNEPTWAVFQKALGATISPSEHWELMSALQSRLIGLGQFVNAIVDKELDDTLRGRLVQAVNTLTRVLRPEQQVQPWQHTTQHFLKSDDALQLMWFSVIAKRHRPLRHLTEDDKAELIASIDEALAALVEGQDIPESAKLPLSDGLRRLRFRVQHLLFFGVESAIDLVLEVYNKTAAIEATATGVANATPGSGGPSYLKILNCVVLAANLFWLPDQTTTAFERYKGWYLKTIIENPKLPKPKTLLLAPPSPANDPQDFSGRASEAAIVPTPPSEKFDEAAK